MRRKMDIMSLELIIKKFLIEESKGPFLLALSGGPDSMALFHLFVKEKVSFHVAHVNHNWRSESSKEVEILKNLCQPLKIPFHLKTLFPENLEGNLEDLCRKERLSFFKEIVEKEDLLGVVMGHHCDDLAETVLKRVFEGATLSRLKGLSIRSTYEGLIIYRPFLTLRKKEILEWLDTYQHKYFLDSTNEDTKYLRTRIRKEIFPTMSQLFGKEIVPSLVRISQASEELDEFLEVFLAPFRRKVEIIDDEFFLDLSLETIQTSFEWKAIIKDFFSKNSLVASHPTLEMVIHLLQKGKGKKQLVIGDRFVVISKKKISIRSK